MARGKNIVEIIIRAKDEAKAGISGVRNALKRTNDTARSSKQIFRGLGKTLVATFGAYAGLRAMNDFISKAGRQQEAVAGLHQAMVSMGRYSPKLEKRLTGIANSLQDTTTFGNEATEEGQKFLLTYKGIGDDTLPRASKAMLDLAALMGGDTVQAANMLGKASMGMVGELRRVGITVDQATYKSKGFLGVLAEIESQVGGQAEAMRQTDYGGLKALGNVIGDVKERIGDLLLLSIGDFIRSLSGDLKNLEQRLKSNTAKAFFDTFRQGLNVLYKTGKAVLSLTGQFPRLTAALLLFVGGWKALKVMGVPLLLKAIWTGIKLLAVGIELLTVKLGITGMAWNAFGVILIGTTAAIIGLGVAMHGAWAAYQKNRKEAAAAAGAAKQYAWAMTRENQALFRNLKAKHDAGKATDDEIDQYRDLLLASHHYAEQKEKEARLSGKSSGEIARLSRNTEKYRKALMNLFRAQREEAKKGASAVPVAGPSADELKKRIKGYSDLASGLKVYTARITAAGNAFGPAISGINATETGLSELSGTLDEYTAGIEDAATTEIAAQTAILNVLKESGAQKQALLSQEIHIREVEIASVNAKLTVYKAYYARLQQLEKQAMAQREADIKRLAGLERQKLGISASAEDQLVALRKTKMTEEQRLDADRSALQRKLDAAEKLSGQQKIDALDKYRQAVLSFGQTYQQHAGVMEEAVSRIRNAEAEEKQEADSLIAAQKDKIAAQDAWISDLQVKMSDAGASIDTLKTNLASINDVIAGLSTEIRITGIDEVSPVVDDIRSKLDELHDKVVRITTIHRDISIGSSGSPASSDLSGWDGSFQAGTNEVPKTGIYRLHRGERVVPAALAKKEKNMLSMARSLFSMPGNPASGITSAMNAAGAGNSAGGMHVSLGVGPVSINVSGTDKNIAAKIADSLDSALASKIEHGRSKIKPALRKAFAI